ncbi:hypothetical protein [Tropicibacter sp. S64]|uniref:hypothetical protein n=1 Tax=Tropicibacter sp. S64 TaxID=3415122 RepID=UPI003C79F6D5
MTQTTARLVLTGTGFVSVYKLAEKLGEALSRCTGAAFALQDAALTGVTVVSCDHAVQLDLGFEGDETCVSVTVQSADLGTDAAQALLARLVYPMVASFPVAAVVWPGTTLRIPKDAFLTGLGATLAPQAAAITAIAPRRVIRTDSTGALRRKAVRIDRGAATEPSLPRDAGGNVIALPVALPAAQAFDAHVHAFEAHQRAQLLRAASKSELQAIRLAEGIQTPTERLSTWAVSLSVATVALPVAAPLIAYNLVKGEDFRVASLAMALGGLFVTLGSTGVMASLPMP